MDSAILMFLSRYNTRSTTNTRYTEVISKTEYRRFTGLQTNDAPCKYLLHRAKEDGHPISTILCLVSMEDLRTIPESELPGKYKLTARELEENPKAVSTSVTCFQKMVTVYARRAAGIPVPNIILIPYDCDPNAAGFNPNAVNKYAIKRQKIPAEMRAAAVYAHIAQLVSQNHLKHLYVDFTGGMRDTSFLLMELSRFLNLLEVPCEEIVYSNYEEKKILSLQSAYSMFPVLSAISSFLNTGNARSMQEAYGLTNDTQSIEGRLLSSLVTFSQAISLCDMHDILNLYHNIIQNLQDLEAYPTDSKTDINILMLKDFTRQIREKFHIPVISDRQSSVPSASYLGLMQWCLDNNLIQQALTLYVEKVPEYLLDAGLIKKQKDTFDTQYPGKSTPVSELGKVYSGLAKDPQIEDFSEMLQKLNREVQDVSKYPNDLSKPIHTFCCNAGRGLPRAKGRFERLIIQYFTKSDGKKHGKQKLDKQKLDRECKALDTNGNGITIYDKTLGRARLDKFIAMCANNPLIQHYCVYDDKEAYANRTQETMRIDALNKLKAGEAKTLSYTSLEPKMLYQILLHYFAVVTLRNQVNHASLSHKVNSLDYCYEAGIYSSKTPSYDMIKNSLQNSVQFMLDLAEKSMG